MPRQLWAQKGFHQSPSSVQSTPESDQQECQPRVNTPEQSYALWYQPRQRQGFVAGKNYQNYRSARYHRVRQYSKAYKYSTLFFRHTFVIHKMWNYNEFQMSNKCSNTTFSLCFHHALTTLHLGCKKLPFNLQRCD